MSVICGRQLLFSRLATLPQHHKVIPQGRTRWRARCALHTVRAVQFSKLYCSGGNATENVFKIHFALEVHVRRNNDGTANTCGGRVISVPPVHVSSRQVILTVIGDPDNPKRMLPFKDGKLTQSARGTERLKKYRSAFKCTT